MIVHNTSITSITIVRYDMIDGCVNDAFTIHTERASDYSDEEWSELVCYASEDPIDFATAKVCVGECASLELDNSGDFGDREELLMDGEPAGAIVFHRD